MLDIYMDHHVRREITEGLRRRGVNVLTAYEDNHHQVADPLLLDRACELGRVLFSQDDDLLVESSERQRTGRLFAGVVYGHQLRVSVRMCIEDLELIAKTCSLDDVENEVIYLPL